MSKKNFYRSPKIHMFLSRYINLRAVPLNAGLFTPRPFRLRKRIFQQHPKTVIPWQCLEHLCFWDFAQTNASTHRRTDTTKTIPFCHHRWLAGKNNCILTVCCHSQVTGDRHCNNGGKSVCVVCHVISDIRDPPPLLSCQNSFRSAEVKSAKDSLKQMLDGARKRHKLWQPCSARMARARFTVVYLRLKARQS